MLSIAFNFPMTLIQKLPVLFEDTLFSVLSNLRSHIDESGQIVLLINVIVIFLVGNILHEPIELGVEEGFSQVDFACFFIDDLGGDLLYFFLAHSKH